MSALPPLSSIAESAGRADPARALSALERLVERSPGRLSPEALALAARLGASSAICTRQLLQRPRLLSWLRAGTHLRQAKGPADYARELRAALRRLRPDDVDGLMRGLRRYRSRESLRIAARDLLGLGALPETAREISALAEACLDAAVLFLDPLLRGRHGGEAGGTPGEGFCVLGMGKLGGGELNFSSDVDLIYVHTRGAEAEHWTRLAELLTRVIGEVTEDGFVFRVDLGLRPDGRGGPITGSAEAVEAYYESFGRTWERAALLKARPVAGDRALGERLLAALAPFVWRRSVDAATVEEMRALKARITRRAAARSEDDLKLGPGGIREIEFFVQVLQLLQGGRDPRLRERSTLGALSNALIAGLLGGRDHDVLSEAYLLLRRVEHRLQIEDERRTHALPTTPAALARLARGLDFDGIAPFLAELARARAGVRALFEDLLHASGVATPPTDAALALAVDRDAPDERRGAALASRGFRFPAGALGILARLARPPESPFARRGAPAPAALELLSGCVQSPDPDRALFFLGELFAELRAPASWFELLSGHRPVARLLTTLFGTSDFLSKSFLRHPELLDALLRTDAAVPRKGAERLGAELAARLAPEEEPEQRLARMRRFKNEEVLRVGLHDVAGNLEVEEVQEELTALADALIAESLALARAELVSRWGEPLGDDGAPAAFAVVGLGTLGGRELGYHSDVDLLFVYSAPGTTTGGSRGRCTSGELFSRLSQKLLSNLSMQLGEGALYRTDVRLRPSGNAGTLVVSLRSFAEHHRRAQVWERQALTRARLVAGERGLFERVREEVLGPCVFRPEPDPRGLAAEILRVRERMERELAGEGPGQYHPKLGRGGLVDVEFATQYLQLVHGAAHPAVREPHTRRALRALAAAGALAPADAALLERGWLFLRRLENRLRIVHDFPLQHLPRGGPALEALARRLGYGGSEAGAKLLADYEAVTAEVRAAYARLLAS